MYIKIPENSICSQCGTKNFTETITRNNQTFLRCRMCGHEKLKSTLTSNSNEIKYVNYDLMDYNSENVF